MKKQGLINFQGTLEPCDVCLATKSKHAPVRKHTVPKRDDDKTSDTERLTVGNRTFCDINGPLPVPSLQGHRWVIEFIDEASNHVQVFLMKTKDEATSKLQLYLDFMRSCNHTIGPGCKFKSDNDSVFCDSKFQNVLRTYGITFQASPPHTQAMNGVAERQWCTLLDMTTAMLKAQKMPKCFWGAAIQHSALIRNNSPTSSVGVDNTITPFELVHHYKFDTSKLRKFGAIAFVNKPKQQRRKLEYKARVGIYIGHALHNKCYYVYMPDTKRIVESISVSFNEKRSVDTLLDTSSPIALQPLSKYTNVLDTEPETNNGALTPPPTENTIPTMLPTTTEQHGQVLLQPVLNDESEMAPTSDSSDNGDDIVSDINDTDDTDTTDLDASHVVTFKTPVHTPRNTSQTGSLIEQDVSQDPLTMDYDMFPDAMDEAVALQNSAGAGVFTLADTTTTKPTTQVGDPDKRPTACVRSMERPHGLLRLCIIRVK